MVVAYPGTMAHAQQCAVALMETGALEAYVTTFVYRRSGILASGLSHLPPAFAGKLVRELSRRATGQLPERFVHTYPLWELVRIVAGKTGAGPVTLDRIWDQMCQNFDTIVARRYVPRAPAIMAFEYTALAAFERAGLEGVARILQLPSLDSRKSETIYRREKAKWPGRESRSSRYFDTMFGRRYERRKNEIAQADLIIANSALTARSHIEAGADPGKVWTVPLAAPPVAPQGVERPRGRPLEVLWAGNVTLMKGAPYLFEAWRLLHAGAAARLQIFGQYDPSAPFCEQVDQDIVFHGSVVRERLFAAYAEADVLVFPTLADGFGMVVLEAMAHGLAVITTQEAGAAEFVTASNGLIVPAADATALANALQWCLDNRDKVFEMRMAALETARQRQWSDFRTDLISGLDEGLRRAGFAPDFTGRP